MTPLVTFVVGWLFGTFCGGLYVAIRLGQR
jgi:hypothetical protein